MSDTSLTLDMDQVSHVIRYAITQLEYEDPDSGWKVSREPDNFAHLQYIEVGGADTTILFAWHDDGQGPPARRGTLLLQAGGADASVRRAMVRAFQDLKGGEVTEQRGGVVSCNKGWLSAESVGGLFTVRAEVRYRGEEDGNGEEVEGGEMEENELDEGYFGDGESEDEDGGIDI